MTLSTQASKAMRHAWRKSSIQIVAAPPLGNSRMSRSLVESLLAVFQILKAAANATAANGTSKAVAKVTLAARPLVGTDDAARGVG